MKYIILISILLLSTSIFAATAPVVSNVVMLQRTDNSELVDITYDLADAENDTCMVSIIISADAGNTFTIIPTQANLSGDIGIGITPGIGKHIIWDIGEESNDIQGNLYRVKVTADDIAANFVFVPAGTFTMGNTPGGGNTDELPTHQVTLSSFYIGKHEVMQNEWQSIMGSNPSSGYGVGDNYPVYYVSWYAILKYCNLLSMAEGLTPVYTISSSTNPADWGTVPTYYDTTWDAAICNCSANGYRLPTEAEWEYAARGGTTTPDYVYSGSDNIDAVAWYFINSNTTTHPVGQLQDNGLGIYDMSGNVYEWCWDRYGSYSSAAQNNPTGPVNGSYRLLRGGSRNGNAYHCRVSFRNSTYPYYEQYDGHAFYGFRLCRTN